MISRLRDNRVVRLGTAAKTALSWTWQASPRLTVLVLCGTVVEGLVSPLQLGLTRELVDGIVETSTQRTGARSLVPIVVLMSLVAAGGRIVTGLMSIGRTTMSEAVGRFAQLQFYGKTVDSDLVRFDDPEWYDLHQRSHDGLLFRPAQLNQAVQAVLASLVTVAGVVGLLFSLHPVLALLAVASALPAVAVQRRSTKLLYADEVSYVSQFRDIFYTGQILSQARFAPELRSLGAGSYILERYARLTAERVERRAGVRRRLALMQVIAGLASSVLLATAYGFLAQQGAAGAFTAGAAAALVGSLATVSANIGSLTSSLVMIEEHATFLRDIVAYLAVPPALPVAPAPATVPSVIDDGIRFEGVRFTYPIGGVEALAGLDLHIRSGEMLALVGDNGAGKSTIVKLLHRFYDPDEGRITIGGVDLRDVDPEALRTRIGSLLQDFNRYQLTVRENVGLGRVDQEFDDSRINAALDVARATSVLDSLPSGLDSRIGHEFGGHELSGGQWQRLAVARLIYRDADVWILDEPTAAMDPEAEAAIFAELRAQLHGRIGIVISHRFSTVRIADRIAVLSGGRVTELGTHEELLALGGRYAELFELQAAGYR